MVARLYSTQLLEDIVTETGLEKAEVLGVVRNQRADLQTVRTWVEENPGTTEAETLGNAWLPGNAPPNGQAVLDVAVAAEMVVRIGGEARVVASVE